MKNSTSIKQWVVIGAGPAGISYLSQLLSSNDEKRQITWIDNQFNGGAFCNYGDVPGNTKVKTFISWATSNSVLQNLASHSSNPLAELKKMEQEKSCRLFFVHKILLNYTAQLRKMVDNIQGRVTCLEYNQPSAYWKIQVSKAAESRDQGLAQQANSEACQSNSFEVIYSKNVCMATGAMPLTHTNLHIGLPNKTVISLAQAFSLNYLKQNVKPGDKIAIVGGSHSAFVIMYLINQLQIPDIKIYNFYKGDLRYAVYMKDFILFDNTGLKGEVADWTKLLLEGKIKACFSLERINVDTEESRVEACVPICEKFIYAHGFSKCVVPKIIYQLPEACGYEGCENFEPNIARFIENSNFDGNICVPSNSKGETKIEGLYGFGFAFPEKVVTRIGELEMNVGLAKFGACSNKWIKHLKL